MSKGITVEREGEKWTKKSLELTVVMPEKHTDEEVQAALTHAEYILDTFLGQPEAGHEAAQIPEFNPELLTKHPWKGRKKPEGGHEKGSLGWGWAKKEEFPDAVIKVLEKGPLTIGEYEFTLDGNLVSTKKVKTSARK